MGADSLWHWIIVLVIVLLLFGRGRVSELMGDVARGVKGFRKAMSDEDTPGTASPNSEPAGRRADAESPTSGRRLGAPGGD
jgi:sec-independent protein translocase protein TatA